MGVNLIVALFAALLQTQAPAAAPMPPKTTGTTPSACLQEIKDYSAKRAADLPPAPVVAAGQTATAEQIQASRLRTTMQQQITQATTVMAKECAARFNAATVDEH